LTTNDRDTRIKNAHNRLDEWAQSKDRNPEVLNAINKEMADLGIKPIFRGAAEDKKNEQK
jgi:hypothetical protein